MSITTKNVTLTAVDDTQEVAINFYLNGGGPTDVWANVIIRTTSGQVLSSQIAVSSIAFTGSGITPNAFKLALKDVLIDRRTALGFA